jgi:hypothetical protein
LYAPSIGLVVAGDVAYNGAHQYLVESGNGGLEEWLKAIDRVEALKPKAVVAGHKNKNLPDAPDILEQRREYLLDAQKLLSSQPTHLEFYNQMMAYAYAASYGDHFDETKLKALPPGSFYTEPSGQTHFAETGTSPLSSRLPVLVHLRRITSTAQAILGVRKDPTNISTRG